MYLLLSGCVSHKTVELEAVSSDPILTKLKEASEVVRDKAVQLQAVENARYKRLTGEEIQTSDISILPSLNEIINLGDNWDGPLDSLLIEVSAIANLNKPRFLRVKPAGGVIVSVDTDFRTAAQIVSQAQASAGSRARITLKVKERLFEVEYLAY